MSGKDFMMPCGIGLISDFYLNGISKIAYNSALPTLEKSLIVSPFLEKPDDQSWLRIAVANLRDERGRVLRNLHAPQHHRRLAL